MSDLETATRARDLPMALDEIDAAWLTRALRVAYPGTTVTSVHIGTVIAGTATKVRLLLGYDAAGHAHGLPPTMWLKGGFIRHDHTYDESFVAEAGFFADWAPHLPINIPKAYFAAGAADGRQGLVLLEDLCARNVTFGHAPNPITADQQAGTLDLLARLHAQWWQSPALAPLTRFSTKWMDVDKVVLRMLEPGYFGRCLALPRGREVTGAYRDPARVADGLRAQWRLADTIPQCFAHGDAHLGNMYFERDGSPGFLDWQAWECAPWAHDVAYSIIGNLTVDDRRAHAPALIGHYLDRLGQYGVAAVPSPDDAWEAFRRHAMHGFMWFTTPVEMQPEEVCEAEGCRFAVAVADLDTFGALGV